MLLIIPHAGSARNERSLPAQPVAEPAPAIEEAERDTVNCESVPGKTGSLSVSYYSSHSMMAIHYVPLSPRWHDPSSWYVPTTCTKENPPFVLNSSQPVSYVGLETLC